MLVLGVDPGSQVTGYGLVESRGGRLAYLHDEQFRLPPRADVADKLARLYDHTTALLEQYRPDQFAVEGVFYGGNAKSMLVLGQARGAVMVAAARFGLALHEYPPSQVKQAVTGYGKAGKEQVQQMVQMLLKRKALAGEHSADALAVAVCHHHRAAFRARTGA